MDEKGKLLFSISPKRYKDFKRDTYIWIGFCLIVGIIATPLALSPEKESNYIAVVGLHIFIMVSLSLIFLYFGFRMDFFAIYEKGMKVPVKPWSKLFVKDYFIPYKEIESVFVEPIENPLDAPAYFELKLKNGGVIPLSGGVTGWCLYNFLESERDLTKLYKIMQQLQLFIETQNRIEANGGKAEWMFNPSA